MTRQVEADDPMELVATPVGGDPEWMLRCLVQEFAWMGWGEADLLGLFHDPEYPVLNQLREYFGDEEVAARVRETLAASGVLRVRAVVDETPEPEDDEPELIQLSTRKLVGD
jgi:hypothetical protein